MERRKTRKVMVGDIAIGGNSPITIQSMLNSKTTDIEGSLRQIQKLRECGCDLIRIAVPDEKSAVCFGEISKICGLPLIADIHYNYKLAHLALDNGAKKIRMNPGNMTDYENIKELAVRMKNLGVPIRVGVNGGSLHPKYKDMNAVDALVYSALDCADIFERYGLSDIVLAIKSSDVMTMIEANRKVAKLCDYPLHLGVTESGTIKSGLIKSAVGIGTLLEEGIGDTIRVSLATNTVEEVKAGKTLLKTLGIRNNSVEVVACPTCSRTEIDVAGLAEKIEDLTSNVQKPIKISVLGCPLNGIGEGKESDIGIAGGKEKSVLLKNGEIYKTVENSILMEEFMRILKEML